MSCSGAPENRTLDNTDCDDGDGAVNPTATEIIEGIDNNCADGILDEPDFIIGEMTAVDTNVVNLTFSVSDPANVTNTSVEPNTWAGDGVVRFYNNFTNQTLMEFNFTFDLASKLNLIQLVFETNVQNGRGSVIVTGLDLAQFNLTKTLYIENIHSTHGICVEDDALSSLSLNCDGANENRIDCSSPINFTLDGNNYTCSYDSVTNYYTVTGLRYSAVGEYTVPTPKRSGGSSGGRSSLDRVVSDVVICNENWICDAWSECANGTQTRDCFDASNCGASTQKSRENQNCLMPELIAEETGGEYDENTTQLTESVIEEGDLVTGLFVYKIVENSLFVASLVALLVLALLYGGYFYLFTK